ncbi:MAG: murein biosynthesis integral membrane protein MurJ, partial [Candidatus Omnitrophica bacterium CG1_02_49_10]
FLVILTVVSILGIFLSPLLVKLMAPGFMEEPGKLALTIHLNQIMFPYILLIGLTALTMGALNSLRHFAFPAFGSSVLNLTLIAAMIFFSSRMGIYAQAAAVLVGGALQLGLNIPILYKKGLTPALKDGFHHPEHKKIGLLLIPRVLGTSIYQINIFVDTILASLAWIVGEGGVAALYYANRLIQFPLGIFSIALAQAALPRMSKEAASGDMEKLKDTLSFSLRMILLIILPTSFGLSLLGRPIIKILFERGQFDAYSTSITQQALFFYAFGLVAYSGIKILVSCFYAMHDTMTPVVTAGIAVVVNITLNLILMWPLKIGGLALATSISATLNFLMLFYILRRRIGAMDEKRMVDSFLRVLAASAVMGAAILVTLRLFAIQEISSVSMRFISLFSVIILAGMIYIAASFIFRVREIGEIYNWISRKR